MLNISVSKRGVRIGLVVCILISVSALSFAYMTYDEDEYIDSNNLQKSPPTGLVITTQSVPKTRLHPSSAGEIIITRPDKNIINSTYSSYWDADPLSSHSVLYVASDRITEKECDAQTSCNLNVVEVLNTTTGDTTRLFSRTTPYSGLNPYHDVDMINDSHILVADTLNDRVFVANINTGMIIWEWDAQSYLPVGAGGSGFPRDWTHLNDVERLDNGNIMISLRNQDQVVFVNRSTGVVKERTLGTIGNHSTLFEQHNPDYLNTCDGILVADSENNRIVEYQRDGGTYKRSWVWTDPSLLWPRDADRLPGGDTLITDSNGNRIIRVDRDGNVIWSVPVINPYEAELIGTGAESTGGACASSANLTSRTIESASSDNTSGIQTALWKNVRSFIPRKLLSGVAFILPAWIGINQLFAVGLLAASSFGLLALEAHSLPYSLRLQIPVVLRRNDED